MKIKLLKKEGNNRQIRNKGMIPVSIHGKDYNKQFVINAEEFAHLLHTKGHDLLSSIFQLESEEETIKAIAKEIQIHPAEEYTVHIDFFKIEKGKDFIIPILVKVENNEKAPFVRENGILYIPNRSIKIICNEDTIINHITCDVGNLHKGDVIQTTDPIWKSSGIRFLKDSPLVTIIDK